LISAEIFYLSQAYTGLNIVDRIDNIIGDVDPWEADLSGGVVNLYDQVDYYAALNVYVEQYMPAWNATQAMI
jgi:hypothetical protein